MRVEGLNKKIIKKILGPKGTKIVTSLLKKDMMVKNTELENIQSQQDKNLKIVGFLQMYNESSKGNLEKVLTHIKKFCNDIVIYDDCSTDNSVDVASKYTKYIIKGGKNRFSEELNNKQILLEKALSLSPDWIAWLDADEAFDRFGENKGIRNLCYYGQKNNIDGFMFQEFNLWKDLSHYRVDELWHQLWAIRLWKNNGKLKFDVKKGLHNRLFPKGIKKISRSEIKVIHFGYSSVEKINEKYEMYKNIGMSGRAIERVKDETGLKLKPFSKDWFPIS